MPLYEFACVQCGARRELYCPSARRAPKHLVCAACHADMPRQVSATNFVVNGYSARTGYTTKGTK